MYECNQMCSDLLWNEVKAKLMWIPYLGQVDKQARNVALKGAVF
jgi:hypothetical protein